jgi:hypothetical protein
MLHEDFLTPHQIVDRRSATLNTAECEFGSEEVIEVDSDHARLTRFGEHTHSLTRKRYLDELSSLVQGLSGKEAKDLISIQRRIFTDVHLFYDGSKRLVKKVNHYTLVPFHSFYSCVRLSRKPSDQIDVEKNSLF